jgi:hypothetical protein
MVVLIPPVFGKPATPCSWYCQRLCSGGCQQPEHGVGAGSAAPAGAAATGTAPAVNSSSAVAATTVVRRDVMRM